MNLLSAAGKSSRKSWTLHSRLAPPPHHQLQLEALPYIFPIYSLSVSLCIPCIFPVYSLYIYTITRYFSFQSGSRRLRLRGSKSWRRCAELPFEMQHPILSRIHHIHPHLVRSEFFAHMYMQHPILFLRFLYCRIYARERHLFFGTPHSVPLCTSGESVFLAGATQARAQGGRGAHVGA